MSESSTKSRRKPLEEGCEGGIWCPVEGHVEKVPHKGGWRIQHIHLTTGQRRTLFERSMDKARMRHEWITSKHGEIGTGSNGQYHADGTHWKEAEREWQEYLKEQS